jgi:hypothetical protein
MSEARRNRRGEHSAAAQQNDRPLAGGEQRQFCIRRSRNGGERRNRSNHYGKWLRIALLPPPQFGDCGLISRIAYEMESAQAFERNDLPALHACNDLFYRMTKLRPTSRAANGFGMETAILGIAIVSRAHAAHGERRHRSPRAIVGKVARDGISWPAMGAIDEGIAMEAASPIEQLIETCLTRRCIRRYARCDPAVHATGNREGIFSSNMCGFGFDGIDPCQWWRLGVQRRQELT